MRKALSLIAATMVAMLAVNAPSASAATSVTFQPQTVLGPGVPKNEIVCKWADGSKNAVLGQNAYHKGSGKPEWEDLTLTTSQLVHPGVATRVTCTAFIRTASLGWDDSTVSLVSGSMRITPGRYRQGHPERRSRRDEEPRRGRRHRIHGHTTGQCDKTKTSKASFTLYVNQWKADGKLCQTDTTGVVLDTPYWVHHAVVPLKMNDFPVRADSGCIPRFNAYVMVKWLGGETGAVQGVASNLTDARGSAGRHNSDMSAVYAIPGL